MKTVRKTQNFVLISIHKYLDNQTVDRLVKVMGFLTDLKVYNYHCSMSLIQDFVLESEAKLPNSFEVLGPFPCISTDHFTRLN